MPFSVEEKKKEEGPVDLIAQRLSGGEAKPGLERTLQYG